MKQVTDKRKVILDTAMRMISKNGFHGTAMSKLAKEAGVSAGIIYYYFKSKDDLITALYKEINRDLSGQLLDIHDAALPLKDQIMQLWKALVQFYLKNPVIASFVQQFRNSPYFSAAVDRETDGYFDFLFEVGDLAIKENLIKKLPRQVFISLCVDFAGTLSQKHARGLMDLSGELIEEIIRTTWDAIKC